MTCIHEVVIENLLETHEPLLQSGDEVAGDEQQQRVRHEPQRVAVVHAHLLQRLQGEEYLPIIQQTSLSTNEQCIHPSL